MADLTLSAGERLLAPATAIDRRRNLADRFWKLLSLVAAIVPMRLALRRVESLEI
jgi:hypothetical protein